MLEKSRETMKITITSPEARSKNSSKQPPLFSYSVGLTAGAVALFFRSRSGLGETIRECGVRWDGAACEFQRGVGVEKSKTRRIKVKRRRLVGWVVLGATCGGWQSRRPPKISNWLRDLEAAGARRRLAPRCRRALDIAVHCCMGEGVS